MKKSFTALLLLCALPTLAQERIHRIKCITLGDNYKADGGSFIIQKSIENRKSTLPAIAEVKETSLFDGFKATNQEVSHTLCKKKGMEKSTDFENSYEICGVSINLAKEDGATMTLSSKFNINEDACSTTQPNGIIHSLRSYLIEGFEEEEKLKIELKENKVGHIFIKNKHGKQFIKRIQCGSESDNQLKVPGANH